MKHLDAFLERNRELAEAATPGPWEPERFDSDNGYIHFSVNDFEMQQVAFCHEDMHPKTYRADAALIAASRTSLPLALEMLEIAVAQLQAILKKNPNAVNQFEAADMAVEFHMGAHSALAALEEKAGRG